MANKDQNQIVYDESGELVSGIFFEFHVPLSDNDPDTDKDFGATWTVSKRTPTSEQLSLRDNDDWLWLKVVYDSKSDIHTCPKDKSHVTGWYFDGVKADAFGGPRISPFVADGFAVFVIASESFGKELKDSGLVGFELKPCAISVNQSNCKEIKVLNLRFAGTGARQPRLLRGHPNNCPFCAKGPIFCMHCGYEVVKCPHCKKFNRIIASKHGGESDKRLRMAPVPKNGVVLLGSKWNGSDFFQSFGRNYITKRAVDWLLSVHAAPFYARPARVCIDGMTKEQLAKLDAAKKMETLHHP